MQRSQHDPAAGTRVRALAGVLVALALYALNVSYTLDYFYLRGAGDDAGWFAWLAANAKAWPIPNPDLIGGSFLALHMSPIFFAATAVMAPLSFWPAAVRFSLFIAVWAPLLWLALFLLLETFSSITFARRCGVAVLLTVNGLTLSIIGFPHIEILIPALGLLAIAICVRARSAAGLAGAAAVALLALMVREDAGLHLLLLLAAMAVARGWAWDRRLVALGAWCLAGSVVALAAQRYAVPGGGQQLGNVYLGHPPLGEVSPASLARRLWYWATRREYIFLPLLALLVAAARDRRLLLGAAIAVPWLLLSLVAVAQQAGDLWSYYCFPLVFMVLWPLLLAQTDSPPLARLLRVQIVMGGLSTAAFVVVGVLPNVGDGGSHDRAPWTHLVPPSAGAIRATEAALAGREGWLFDYGAAALAIGALRPGQFVAGLAFSDAEIAGARGFVRFDAEPRYLEAAMARLGAAFPVCEAVSGTALRVCVRGP